MEESPQSQDDQDPAPLKDADAERVTGKEAESGDGQQPSASHRDADPPEDTAA